MAAPTSQDEAQRRLDAIQRHSGNMAAAARELNLKPNTLIQWRRGYAGEETLTAAGYDIRRDDWSPKDAWDSHAGAFERKLSNTLRKREGVIKRKGPFAIFHSTDEHIDDDATPLRIIQQDIEAAHRMGAIMCHGGDLLNNWPVAGKLAKQWAEQSCTLPAALLRARHFIDIFEPDVWTDGNHEEMNPYLMQMFDGWLPKNTIRDYWTVSFRVQVPNLPDYRVRLSHKFQKGSSWFHHLHGHIREMLESEETDLYLDGHFHSYGVMHHGLPERSHDALMVASAGYKIVDKYASRISRGGKIPRLYGRAHWIIVDDQSETDRGVAFKEPNKAEAYLSGLQNLREV